MMLTFASIAHEQALELCQIMHRDVSAGNILIFPEIVHLSNGGYAIGMKGLLSDWELAKVIPELKSALFASQPERTVSILGSYAINGDQF